MNPILFILMVVGIFVAFVLVVALLGSVILLSVGRSYAEKQRKGDLKKMEQSLPGKNCGTCGNETCTVFAQALLDGANLERCPHLQQEQKEGIAAVLEARRLELEQMEARAQKAQEMERKSILGRWHSKRKTKKEEI